MPSHLWSFNVIPVRCIAALVPLTLIALGVFFNQATTHWTFLLAVAVGLGYIHFSIATYYQWQGIKRAPDSQRRRRWFWGLVIGSGAVSVVLITLGHTLLLAILSIGYFVLHVLANEHTFLSRELPVPPYWSFLSLVLPAGALYAVALVHPSLSFGYDLQYAAKAAAEQMGRLAEYFPVAQLDEFAVIMTAGFLLIVPSVIWVRYRMKRMASLFALVGVLTLLALVVFPVINFIYVLHFVLVYHFVLLSLLFLKPMYEKNRRAFRLYLELHVLIGAPLVLLLLVFMRELNTHNLIDVVFHFQLFVALSIMHISASLLNEPWFQKIFRLQP